MNNPLGDSPKKEDTVDLFLCHCSVDKEWVSELATRIENEKSPGQALRVFFDQWDMVPGENVVRRLESGVAKARFVGVVMSPEMLVAEWPTMEWTMAVYEDPSGRKGKIIPILRKNCDIPPSLRIRTWLDFRTPEKSERSYSKLIAVLSRQPLPRGARTLDQSYSAPSVQSPEYFNKPLQFADKVAEQLVSNLLPVKTMPKTIWQSNCSVTSLRDVYRHIEKFRQNTILPTFILKQGSLYSFWDPSDKNSVFRGLISGSVGPAKYPAESWLDQESRQDWLIEMLNRGLRHYCTNLGLQSDEKRKRWFYPPLNGADRVVEWNTGKRRSKRTVVRKYTKKASGEIFWAHLTLIPRFLLIERKPFLRLEPSWTFTVDGYELLPPEKRASVSTKWMYDEYNPSVFYHIRFWTFILAQGRQDIIMDVGNSHLEVFGTPATANLNYGIDGDHLNVDRMYEVAESELPSPDYLIQTGEA